MTAGGNEPAFPVPTSEQLRLRYQSERNHYREKYHEALDNLARTRAELEALRRTWTDQQDARAARDAVVEAARAWRMGRGDACAIDEAVDALPPEPVK